MRLQERERIENLSSVNTMSFTLVAAYLRLINKLITLFEDGMCDRKEKLVESLGGLIESSCTYVAACGSLGAHTEIV